MTRTRDALVVGLFSVAACACAPPVLKPPCPNPAILEGHWDRRAPNYLIILQPGADSRAAADAFIDRYGLYTAGRSNHSFAVTDIGPQGVATLRCQSFVKAVIHDGVLENIVQSGT
jgi:hypothetical protein